MQLHEYAWRRTLSGTAAVAAIAVLAFGGMSAWAQSNPATAKVGAVSQQEYAGAIAQALSGLQRAIKFGSAVYAKEMVRTGENGSTELQFLDDAKLHIGANASVQLDDYEYDAASGNGGGLVEMFVGAYDFVSGKMHTDDKVKLVTPTVTIGLRGTAFSLFIAGDGRTDIVVREGLLSLAPCRNGPASTLAAGQTATVDNSCTVTITSNPRQYEPQPIVPRTFKPIQPPKHRPEHRSKSSSG